MRGTTLILGVLTVAASIIVSMSFGAVTTSINDVIQILIAQITKTAPLNSMIEQIVIELRLPRILLAFIAGAGLALSGAILQLVTRNPLADPYLFGISSGASFGAVALMTVFSSVSMLYLPIAAFIGSLFAVILVLSIAGTNSINQIERMLLAGVASSFLFSAASSSMLYHSDPQAAAAILFWTLGSFAQAQWSTLVLPTIIISISLLVFFAFSRHTIAISSGDETASTLGVKVARVRLLMLVVSSMICAVIVASCGGISFVGLLIPHLVRIIFGQKIANNYLVVAMLGGLFMIYVDIIARTLLENQEIPLGIITSLIGSVFFLYILRRRRIG
ncbi:MAG: iron ABC transporter permease [Gammaproteobacteria bacterium]|nr:iron ABC transporter permease [Gammaproteobacteria bacterium]